MDKQVVVYSIKRWQLVSLLVTLVVLIVSLPVGVMAATGTVMNLRDYSNTAAGGWARVVNNRVVTEQCDPATTAISASTCARVIGGKQLVSDGSGAMTVDGSLTPSAPTTPYAMNLDGSTSSGYYPSASGTVPAGKRYVIQTVSVTVDIPSGQTLQYAAVNYKTGGVNTTLWLPVTPHGTYAGNGLTYYEGALSVNLYADAGSTVTVEAFRGTTSGTAYISGRVAGYLV